MSKELEALERIRSHNYHELPKRECLRIIETALKRLEKIETTTHSVLREDISSKLNAIEIIKEKPIVALVDYKYTYEEWLEIVDEKDKDLFKNKEEYDLLKEMLL